MVKYENNLPIYSQLETNIKKQMVAGRLTPGQKLESVRELALKAEVNPNTMQRALANLEREGYLYTERTNGRFVTKDAAKITNLKEEFSQTIIENFINTMQELGYKKQQLLTMLQNYLERGSLNERAKQ